MNTFSTVTSSLRNTGTWYGVCSTGKTATSDCASAEAASATSSDASNAFMAPIIAPEPPEALRDDEITPAVLGVVEPLVGAVQQSIRRGVAAKLGDTEADRDGAGKAELRPVAALDRDAQLLAERLRVVQFGVRQTQQEFLAAVAREHVAGAATLAQRGGDTAQHGVAGGVRVLIVHALEQIDVGERNRETPALAPAAVELPREIVVCVAPVEQAREIVARG